MLVVSRKQNQTVVFPNLGISVEILRVAGKVVRVGVTAPDDIRILRGELNEDTDGQCLANATANATANAAAEAAAKENHALRNRLNQVSLAMHLIQKQLQAGKTIDAACSVSHALQSLAELDELVAAKRPSSIVDAADQRSFSKSKKHALLVEDDANERELLAGYLRLSGYRVDTAEDGVAAVEFLKSHKPDVVVVDMQMPRMNGQQTVQTIRNNPEWDDVQLFVVSGMQPTELLVPTGNRGINRWFEKPLKPNDLVQHLSATLN